MARSSRGGYMSGGTRNILNSDNNNIFSILLNSLTFGIFDIHQCNSEDNSWYCKFSRFFGALMKIIIILFIFYALYILIFKTNIFSSKKYRKK